MTKPTPATATREITALSARDLSRAIHDRKLSCTEVMTACLDRIEGITPGDYTVNVQGAPGSGGRTVSNEPPGRSARSCSWRA